MDRGRSHQRRPSDLVMARMLPRGVLSHRFFFLSLLLSLRVSAHTLNTGIQITVTHTSAPIGQGKLYSVCKMLWTSDDRDSPHSLGVPLDSKIQHRASAKSATHSLCFPSTSRQGLAPTPPWECDLVTTATRVLTSFVYRPRGEWKAPGSPRERVDQDPITFIAVVSHLPRSNALDDKEKPYQWKDVLARGERDVIQINHW